MDEHTGMRKRIVRVAILLVTVIGLWTGRSRAEDQIPADVSHDNLIQRIDKLESLNDKERQALVRDMRVYDYQVRSSLEHQLDSTNPDTQFYAAYPGPRTV